MLLYKGVVGTDCSLASGSSLPVVVVLLFYVQKDISSGSRRKGLYQLHEIVGTQIDLIFE